MKATYSPEDNKLRFYPEERLSAEDYKKTREMGFIWAPKQGLFVAPMWTPQREDFLLSFCDSIEDEDKSLVERQEERAERFNNYSEKRAEDAERQKDLVANITGHIPLGQPILIGHHSEKRAKKDAQRIENAMRKAVNLWETSEYWTLRAKGALQHAKYKELPKVRVNRIKRIEADARKAERENNQSEKFLRMWQSENMTIDKARSIANYDYISKCFPVSEFPRLTPEASNYEGMMSLYSALDGIITPEQAKEIAIRVHERGIKHRQRWLNHYQNRLLYEETMLDGQGASKLLEPKPRPKQLPLCNYKASEGIQVENLYHKNEFSNYRQIEITTEEYKKMNDDWKGTRIIENSHRIRIAHIPINGQPYYQREPVCVFLTDSKTHEKPEAIQRTVKLPEQKIREYIPEPINPQKEEFQNLKETLKQGFQIVTANQLFPTPPEIAKKMVDLAELSYGLKVLEPSAGTGSLIKAIVNKCGTCLTSVEINASLCDVLRKDLSGRVINADFLSLNGELGKFDRIIMNPPFENGVDIKHIKHALDHLDENGILVALCANGSRQNEALKTLSDYWEVLPAGSFKESGTNVNIALMVIRK